MNGYISPKKSLKSTSKATDNVLIIDRLGRFFPNSIFVRLFSDIQFSGNNPIATLSEIKASLLVFFNCNALLLFSTIFPSSIKLGSIVFLIILSTSVPFKNYIFIVYFSYLKSNDFKINKI